MIFMFEDWCRRQNKDIHSVNFLRKTPETIIFDNKRNIGEKLLFSIKRQDGKGDLSAKWG